MLDPVAVALKFGFLAVLYLFLLWMARSALKDLRRSAGEAPEPAADATGMHTAGSPARPGGTPKLRVGSGGGHSSPLPAQLRTLEVLREADAVRTRTFELTRRAGPCAGSAWTINGLEWDQVTE